MTSLASFSSVASSSTSKLEPFLVLARSTRPQASAAANLIEQVTCTPCIFTFSELFDIPGISELRDSSEHASSYRLLHLFAYGTISDYLTNPSDYPTLSDSQLFKLRQLTLLSVISTCSFSSSRTLSYPTLCQQLDLSCTTLLEDLIIESIYTGILFGKLNQLYQRFDIDFAISRDLISLDPLLNHLDNWKNTTLQVLSSLQSKIDHSKHSNSVSKSQDSFHRDVLFQNLSSVLLYSSQQQHHQHPKESITSGSKLFTDWMEIDSDVIAIPKSETTGLVEGEDKKKGFRKKLSTIPPPPSSSSSSFASSPELNSQRLKRSRS